MLTIDVINTRKGTNENAQYRYRVHVNGEDVQRGEIGGHNRGHGWAVLLSSIADKHLVKVECGWTRIPSIIEDEDTWTTLCGNVWMFEEGTPQDNGMKFCCYCGRPLVQIEAEMDEKIIDGLNEAQWQARYIAYMKAHSNAEDWECEESAGVAWDESTDESPEECASEELSYWR